MSPPRSDARAGNGVATTSFTGVTAVERDNLVSLVRAGRTWSQRRVVAATLLTPVLVGVLAASGGGWSPRGAPWWTTIIGLVALVGAMTLATYMPRPGFGRRLDVGCSPCAVVAALSVVAAAAILSTAPHQLVAALAALGIAGLGLRQRLAESSSCTSPVAAHDAGDQAGS